MTEQNIEHEMEASQNQASTSLRHFMRAVWGDGEADAPDYSTYCDATLVAMAMGAKPTGEGKAGDAGDGDNGAEYLFPDGTSVWIVTDPSGRGVGLVGPHGLSILP